MSFAATWRDLQIAVLNEVSQTEGEIPYDIPYMWNPKRNDMGEVTYKTKRDSQAQRTNAWLLKEKDGGKRIVKELWLDMYTLLYSKWITNEDLLYSTWNSVQCYVAAQIGGEFGGQWIHVYVQLRPLPLT